MEDAELISTFSEKKLDKMELHEPIETQENRGRYKYDFTLINYKNFSKAIIEKVFLPKTIRVHSEFELNHSFAEMAVQAQIIKLLPESYKLDLYSKRRGMPSDLSFDLSVYGKEFNESIHLRRKRIGYFKNPDMAIDFDFKDIVYSICFKPFNKEELDYFGFEHCDFNVAPGSNGEVPLPFMDHFPSRMNSKCFMVELAYIDTFFKDPLIYKLGSERWNIITAFALFSQDFKTLNFLAHKYDHFQLDFNYSKKHRHIMRTVAEINVRTPFTEFFAMALDKVAVDFDESLKQNPQREVNFDEIAIYYPSAD